MLWMCKTRVVVGGLLQRLNVRGRGLDSEVAFPVTAFSRGTQGFSSRGVHSLIHSPRTSRPLAFTQRMLLFDILSGPPFSTCVVYIVVLYLF